MRHLTLCCAIGLFAGAVALGDEPFFTGLGHLAGGWSWSSALGISPDGSTVVGESDYGLKWPNQAFRWTRHTGMVGLGGLYPARIVSSAAGVSGDGSVVVGTSNSARGTEAFRWTEQQGMIGLGDLQAGPTASSMARAVSADGQVVVGLAKSASVEAFRWTEDAGMVGLGFLPSPAGESQAFAASADGSVIVGFSETAQYPHGEAFRWENGKMLGLGVLPGASESWAWAVSADGSVIAGDSYPRAFRWTEATGMIDLGPGGACGMSADGSIIVGTSGAPVLWDATGQRHGLHDLFVNQYNLNLTGWELWAVDGVSADGQTFVGYGRNPSRFMEAWIAHIPEPATLALFALGLALTAGGRGRWAGVRR